MRSTNLNLHHGEVALITLAGCTMLAAIIVTTLFDQAVNWFGFTPPIATGLILCALGLYARASSPRKKAADFFVSAGIYVFFGASMAILIFSFFPIIRAPIDPTLFAIDAYTGYDWATAVAYTAQFPLIGKLMGLVYSSSLWQVMGTLAVLAAMGRSADMHRFLMAGSIALICAFAIWVMLPSFGPAAYLTVNPSDAAAINLVVNPAYGATLMQYATDGIAVIGPDTIIGAIAFPSFHTVMMCLVLWFTRNTPVFWVAVAVNILMVPAILVHGGHHVIDVCGGIVTFALATMAAHVVVAPRKAQPSATPALG